MLFLLVPVTNSLRNPRKKHSNMNGGAIEQEAVDYTY